MKVGNETQKEPFGIWHQGETEEESDFFLWKDSGDVSCPDCIKLYTTPPTRQPLTEDQIEKCYETTGHYQTLRPQDRFAVLAIARAIEAAHGITGEPE